MSSEFGSFQPEPVPPIIPKETSEGALLFSTPPTERGSGRWKNILKWTGRGFAVGFAIPLVLIPILAAGAEAALTMSQNSVTLLEAMTRVPSTILASMSGGAIVGVFAGLCGAVTLGGLALTSPEYLSVRSS